LGVLVVVYLDNACDTLNALDKQGPATTQRPGPAIKLPRNPTPEKLKKDPRSKAFIAKYDELFQYEVDALPPNDLRDLFLNAITAYWHDDAYDTVLEREKDERQRLEELADGSTDESTP
jgi:hypothetical protein